MLCRGGAVIQQTGILFFTLYLYFVCDYQWELVFSPLDCTCSTLPSPCTFLHAPLALWADVFWPVVTDPTNLLTFYCLLSPGSSLTLRFQVHGLTSFLFLFFYFFPPSCWNSSPTFAKFFLKGVCWVASFRYNNSNIQKSLSSLAFRQSSQDWLCSAG